jgi:creatinine amidohydrolase/Fe(II)-dependent formamide hydrolase-like protein/7-cyano-7-deazaguanine synthase in queuosine biosynthesis
MPQHEIGTEGPDPRLDPPNVLAVIPKLEVGPVQLERHRITMPYRVSRKGTTDAIQLVYRFEEDVFLPNEYDSVNLASMMGVQAALNYGLFCDQMIFHGSFDSDDQRFIQEMASNTAREIFVKKFLQPNPFLVEPVNHLPPTKKRNYLHAQLLFPDKPVPSSHEAGKSGKPAVHWKGDLSRHAVLSSGGKDSLLTFCVLKEIGYEVHPVFINESGRHWFTALNAYRHFAAHENGTARVWTNSDQVFNWMLRHLPFVRKDFQNARSDAYPIRLWTVPVFLFGALPILRKRGIGRLLIGNEHDTTRKVSFKGISHHDGLYDQSRYFDDTVTRFFHRKGWRISQYSVLRPLSDLLIEKILVERYPELQGHQVSCHAAHKEGSRIRPCGRCEKCRRIVAMLSAIGADPTRCGYTVEQTRRCLADLTHRDLHVEAEGVEHLAFLLSESGLISQPFIGSIRAREKPEIMKLRFNSERSPVETIPVDLRGPLYRIYLEHAQGAVRKRGKTWVDFGLLNDAALNRPYPFESPRNGSRDKRLSAGEPRLQDSPILGELTWPEAQKRFKTVDVGLLPVGAIEQHGPHLPLDSDAFDAEYLAHQVAKSCEDPKPIVLPLIPYGVSYHHEGFSGTISVNPQTLSQLVYDIGMSAARNGITKLVIINGHGGNSPALHFAAQTINRDAHIFTCVDTGESSDPDIDAIAETPNDVHAGEIETSTTLAVRPEMVRLTEAKKFIPRFSSRYLDFTSKRSVSWYAHTAKISPSGILGDPTKATAEKGRRMWARMIKNLVEFVEELKTMSLDELYQRRY